MSRRISKGKEIRPTFFVFCEGETEEAYIAFLRSRYRVPIEIDPKIARNGITEKYINNYKKQRTRHPKDKTFLIYDCDVPETTERLRKIKDVDLLLSNPCFELWYLLHYQHQTASLPTKDCEQKICGMIKEYKKGHLDEKMKSTIVANQNEAIKRAESLIKADVPVELNNPSTDVYRFVEELEKVK
ncbi:MAG: RloB family protein [Bacteroidales bacterium]|nr:RloB family protein [Bacteroidales bacterium]